MQIYNDNYIFGLDIGTRSIVGIIGYKQQEVFHVVASHVAMHETRAMLDGQIHDIESVASTINAVKEALEEKTGISLHKVCIAAAGRVLKTLSTEASMKIEDHMEITSQMVQSLELIAMEKAMRQVNYAADATSTQFFCVGYSVTNYYLNDYMMKQLAGHKGSEMKAEILSTFLPHEVVDSLYKVVELAGLSVYSLTLEPIAAIQVAIPDNFRLLNIALVDIGAGTSDIAITKEGSIIAYGMIPSAGDEITEAIVHRYLVDFKTAESIKIKASGRGKKVTFKDAMGLKQSIELDDVRKTMEHARLVLAKQIADKICELNSGKSTNAVFLVGGGGQTTNFSDMIAEQLQLPRERVALRGKDVMGSVVADDPSFKKDPEFVTPIGICLTGLSNNQQDFIEVYLNDEAIRIFNTNRLSVMDVVALKGIEPKSFIPRRGEALICKVNGVETRFRGEIGEPAHIYIDQKEVDLSHPIKAHDYITLIPAVNGTDAMRTVHDILDKNPVVMLNDERKILEPIVSVNQKIVGQSYRIADGDDIRIGYPTVGELLGTVSDNASVFVNEVEATVQTELKPKDKIHVFDDTKVAMEEPPIEEVIAQQAIENDSLLYNTLHITVNDTPIVLTGKTEYIFVDVFEVYPFDRSKPRGTLVTKINEENAGYMEPIHEGDTIQIYWKEKS